MYLIADQTNINRNNELEDSLVENIQIQAMRERYFKNHRRYMGHSEKIELMCNWSPEEVRQNEIEAFFKNTMAWNYP